jgi:hypothetical protein
MLKSSEHAALTPVKAEPDKIIISLAGTITDVIPMVNRRTMDALDDQYIWGPKLIDMRFNYRPENPLYLLLVRAYRLESVEIITNTPAYAGCKSWVPLDRPVETKDATPVLDDAEYSHRTRMIVQRLASM